MSDIIKHASELMPKSKEALCVLSERSALLATEPVAIEKHENEISYVHFILNDDDYGIPYDYVKEVMSNVSLTKTPRTPAFIAGVINFRGALTAVLNLKLFFNLPSDTAYENNAYIIIIKTSEFMIGILADRIEGSKTYDAVSLEPPLAGANTIKADYIIGINRSKIAIINLEAIVASLSTHIGHNQQRISVKAAGLDIRGN